MKKRKYGGITTRLITYSGYRDRAKRGQDDSI
jgi:hypothetical protein